GAFGEAAHRAVGGIGALHGAGRHVGGLRHLAADLVDGGGQFLGGGGHALHRAVGGHRGVGDGVRRVGGGARRARHGGGGGLQLRGRVGYGLQQGADTGIEGAGELGHAGGAGLVLAPAAFDVGGFGGRAFFCLPVVAV